MWHDLWDADHRPCGEREPNWLPSSNWTHLWRELLPSPWWRGVDRAGLLGMTTMPSLTEPTVELESGRTSSRSSGTMLWRPTIGLDEDGAVLARPVKPMNTSMPRSLCKSLAVMFRLVIQCWWTDWTFRLIFGRAPLWNVECWTAFQWTGSLDLVWDRTFRSWWSSQELENPEGCLGVQLSLFQSICPDQPVV